MNEPVTPPPADAAAAMAAVASAVKGAGTPDSASLIAKPERFSILYLAGGGIALTGVLVGIILLVGSPRWPWLGLPIWPDAVAEARITGLVTIAVSLSGIIGLIMFRLASRNLTRFEARAGPGSIIIDTGETRSESPPDPDRRRDHGRGV